MTILCRTILKHIDYIPYLSSKTKRSIKNIVNSYYRKKVMATNWLFMIRPGFILVVQV